MVRGPHAGVGIEGAEPDEVDTRLRPVLRPQLRAAPRAGDLRVAVLGAPGSQQLFALHDPQRAGRRAAGDRRGVPRPPLTPAAMAIARTPRRPPALAAKPAPPA